MEEVSEFTHDCQAILSEGGLLAQAIPNFKSRSPQVLLSKAIAETIEEQSTLVAEAGTGIGKTFAYLIPCLLSGKKVLISTATKILQDQLYHKDLPLLMQCLNQAGSVQVLKGRVNYLCRYRIELYAKEGRFGLQQTVYDLVYIQEKLPQFTYGERSELPEISEESPVWPYVTSTQENCLGSECEHYHRCFLVKARKKAMAARVVVINHHLFFADSKLKEEGFGELLPDIDVVVFDEAHQLAGVVENFYEERLSTRQIRDAMDDVLREWPQLDLENQAVKDLPLKLDEAIEQLLSALASHDDRISWERVERNQAFQEAWTLLFEWMDTFLTGMILIPLEPQSGLLRCITRIETLKTQLLSFRNPESKQIRWIERFTHTVVFHATPFDISESFRDVIGKKSCAYVFTSATLTIDASFDAFIKPLGIEGKTMILPSPFDYREQALLYVPRDMPDPKDPRYYDVLLSKAMPIINACGGRCFFLFTSHKALQTMAKRLKNHCHYPLLVQGDESKSILLARFRSLGNAVLLGTATFWEGVDVKGNALSCVIIDKIPFSNPTDPVICGKMAYYKSQNLSGFDELLLPNAVLALKQGVGRLIRDMSDRGLLMLADPRLTARDYGRRIFASLPALKKTREEQTALAFINTLALNDEIISN